MRSTCCAVKAPKEKAFKDPKQHLNGSVSIKQLLVGQICAQVSEDGRM
jgi:hypothetical protein